MKDDVNADSIPGKNDTTETGGGVNTDAPAPDAPAPVAPAPVAPAPVAPAPDASAATLADIFAHHAQKPEGFDEARHAVNSDGSPRMRADGSFAMKRGRKKGQVNTGTKSAPPLPGEKSKIPAAGEISEAEATARMATNLIINGCVVIFGDEWKPVDASEPQIMAGAFTDYFEAKGVTKLPPEVGLFVALAAYALPRFMQPKTRDRLAFLKLKFGGIFSRFKKKAKRGDATADE